MPLKVSDNKRYLVHEDGSPFFYLGDTAWELFHRSKKEEAEFYLRDRAEKKFTVIQSVILSEQDGLNVSNAYGHTPLHNHDPTKPNEAYFEHVDWIIKKANSLGLYMGVVPTWGDKWNKKWGVGPEIFNPKNAAIYGEFVARRYGDYNIIWILGGDRPVENDEHRAIVRSMAAGIRKGVGRKHLISFHPSGGPPLCSSIFFHDDDWLDFNMIQSGHVGRDKANYEMIEKDYNRLPIKPCMDAEPCYEDHLVMTPDWKHVDDEWFDDYSVRKAAYWSVFAGAHGHTYGCHGVWQMWQPGREPITHARTPWKRSLNLPGACQMRYLRRLMGSRPFLTRIPDQTLLVSEPGTGGEHVQATRDIYGRYAFVYIPTKRDVTMDLTKLKPGKLKASWYDPRNGKIYFIAKFDNNENKTFSPPDEVPDWVLIIDAL